MMICPSGGELDRATKLDHNTDSEWNGVHQSRILHRDRRECCARQKGSYTEHGPHEKVTHALEHGQPTQRYIACSGDCLAVAPQHRDRGGQHQPEGCGSRTITKQLITPPEHDWECKYIDLIYEFISKQRLDQSGAALCKKRWSVFPI